MGDDFLTEEQAVEMFRHAYREARQFNERHANGGPGADEAASYIAALTAELVRESGIGAAFTHEYFADARDGDRDNRPEQAADAYRAAGPEGDFRGAAGFFLRFGAGFFPETIARRLGQILAGVSMRQIPPQLREILERTPGHLSSDQAFRSFAIASVCAAKYMHNLEPAKYRSWLDAHGAILPADADGYPSDDRRQEWHDDFAPASMRAAYGEAGVARRKAGAGADIGTEFSSLEIVAAEWADRDPGKTRDVFDRIRRDATAREGREAAPKGSKKKAQVRRRK